MNEIQKNSPNEELAQLGTHASGATDLHKTRTTSAPVQIDPPVSPNPGAIDNRDHRFDNKKNGEPI
ncbi:hypothetical protein PAESOLCIP111_04652 [Paenibacillus solanacearum]|uniref:Uncharacterized protein n=1 Tax=Paenibacillus solanacearum TaxID=2048548 RepID=A0A916K4N7_9BACL|nr:hypothetical protein [Paenibacillus solanacearum]CAG7644216.1 hypothetical protein PAESOLCIP111_04652 [Paenibacillus solanacearum]